MSLKKVRKAYKTKQSQCLGLFKNAVIYKVETFTTMLGTVSTFILKSTIQHMRQDELFFHILYIATKMLAKHDINVLIMRHLNYASK